MAGRPRPKILTQTPLPKKDLELHIVEGQGFYVITYDDKPINIIKVNKAQHLWKDIKRYMKVGYVHKAHAVIQTNKLNKLFKTDKFKLKELK